MSTIRVKHDKSNPYFQLNRASINDDRLSFKAVGILAYLLSKPDDWVVHVEDLVRRHTDGATAVKSGLKELRECGYIQKRLIRNETGQFVCWETHIFESPQPVEEEAIDPAETVKTQEDPHRAGNPQTGTPANWSTSPLVNNDILPNKEGTEERKHTQQAHACGVRSSQDGFDLSGEQKQPKPESYALGVAKKVAEVLIQKSRVSMSNISLTKWSEDVRKFMMKNEYTREDIDPVLNWWIENIDDRFTPNVVACKSFVDKFDSLRAAMRRSRMPEKTNGSGSRILDQNDAARAAVLEKIRERKVRNESR